MLSLFAPSPPLARALSLVLSLSVSRYLDVIGRNVNDLSMLDHRQWRRYLEEQVQLQLAGMGGDGEEGGEGGEGGGGGDEGAGQAVEGGVGGGGEDVAPDGAGVTTGDLDTGGGS